MYVIIYAYGSGRALVSETLSGVASTSPCHDRVYVYRGGPYLGSCDVGRSQPPHPCDSVAFLTRAQTCYALAEIGGALYRSHRYFGYLCDGGDDGHGPDLGPYLYHGCSSCGAPEIWTCFCAFYDHPLSLSC